MSEPSLPSFDYSSGSSGVSLNHSSMVEGSLQDLEELISHRVKQELQNSLQGELNQNLSDFQHSLEEKIRKKVIDTLISELSQKEEGLIQRMSTEFLSAFRQRLERISSDEQLPPISLPSSNTPTALPSPEQEKSEMEAHVFLGYPPSISPPLQDSSLLDKSGDTAVTTPLEIEQEESIIPAMLEASALSQDPSRAFQRQFLSYLLLSAFLWGILGSALIIAIMPWVFLQETQVFLAVGTMFISVGFVSISEYRYFRKQGLFDSLRGGQLVFRPFIYFFKLLLWTVPLSFLFLLQVKIHEPYLRLPTSSFFHGWVLETDHFFSFLFTVFPPVLICSVQRILFFSLLFWVLYRGIRWVFSRSEI